MADDHLKNSYIYLTKNEIIYVYHTPLIPIIIDASGPNGTLGPYGLHA